MADPIKKNLLSKTITLAASNITAGVIHISDRSQPYHNYFHCYRIADGTAPTDITDFIPFDSHSVSIANPTPIDVYLYCTDAGRVRIDA